MSLLDSYINNCNHKKYIIPNIFVMNNLLFRYRNKDM
jgi:hypothetical protein